MKSFIVALLAVSTAFVTVASADSLAPRRQMIQLEGRYFNANYVATVDNYGLLKIETALGDAKPVITRKQLSPITLRELAGSAISLSRAEIKTVNQDIVCMMIMWPTQQSDLSVSTYEEQTNLPTGQLRETLTEEGCWLARHVFPADEYTLGYARSLKKIMEILVFENAKFPVGTQF